MYNPYIDASKSANRRKKGLAIVGVALSAALAVGGITAYLVDTDNREQAFTLGKVDISMNKDTVTWADVVPGQEVTMDTTVTNSSTVPAYFAYKVTMPVYDNNNGKSDGSQWTDLYSQQYKSGVTFNDSGDSTDWTKEVGAVESSTKTRTYTYYLKNPIAVSANPDKLIEKYVVSDYCKQPDVDTANARVKVEAFAVQAYKGKTSADGTTYANAKAAIDSYNTHTNIPKAAVSS